MHICMKHRDPFDEFALAIRGEKASALGQAGRRLKQALAALEDFACRGGAQPSGQLSWDGLLQSVRRASCFDACLKGRGCRFMVAKSPLFSRLRAGADNMLRKLGLLALLTHCRWGVF